jgi:hypothetical protein
LFRMLATLRSLGDIRRKLHGFRSFVDSVLSK